MNLHHKPLAWIGMTLGGLLLAGCTGTIFNPFNFNKGRSVLVDARQRAIINVEIDSASQPGQVKPKRIICAEPSPDVALAVAHSLSAGVGVFGYGSGTLSQGVAEGVAQLGERMGTIQLLRDGLYRACEAYANGAISNITYAMIISRLDEVATTLLLGEVAGGAFGRKLAAIGSGAEAKATVSMIQELLKKESPEGTKPQAANQPGGASPTGKVPSPAGQKNGGDSSKLDSESIAKATISGLIAGGAISGRAHTAGIAAEVAKIHKAFLDDMGLESLLVACVTALSQEKVNPPGLGQTTTPSTELGRICKDEVFKDLNNNLIKLSAALAKAEVMKIQVEADKIRAETHNALVKARTQWCGEVLAGKTDGEDDKKTCKSWLGETK